MRYIIRRHDAFSISLRLQLPPELLSRVCQWENDVTLRHLHHVCESERAYETMHFTPAVVRDKIFDMTQQDARFFWFLELEDVPVGYLTGERDPGFLYKDEPYTFWPRLLIGDVRARGKGFGKVATAWSEEIARLMGCARIELGVFAHNKRALRMYSAMGYEEIAHIPDCTWWQGSRHEEIRMEKWL